MFKITCVLTLFQLLGPAWAAHTITNKYINTIQLILFFNFILILTLYLLLIDFELLKEQYL